MSSGSVLSARGRAAEVANYLPIPPQRSREFWTKWKIQHIRQLSTTGHATQEPLIPEAERTQRVLDRLYLTERRVSSAKLEGISTEVALATDSPFVFSSPLYLGDMSFGALSGTPNIAIAKAADATGVLAGTGEGGLLNEVAECSRITVQWASARFGVDVSSLRRGQAVVIKIGQGAKPGIGGHLPSAKVTEPIAETRRIPVGRDAISPAPHHDIYSIEDLGQRILALKEAARLPVFVKVGATNYVPYIASGIARMGASGIIIDGAGAGTGAAPSVVKNNVGIPIEFATASVDSILRKEGLREGFTVIAAGRVSTPEDSIKLMALGADVTSLGTATLMALGCLMVHKCHIGYCPAVLTNKIASNQVRVLSLRQSVEWVVNLVNGWTEEMKILLERLGISDVRQLRGRRDVLTWHSLNPETTSILGLVGAAMRPSAGLAELRGPQSLTEDQKLWTPPRLTSLREMAGTTGKFPAESEISSMGTNSPPLVEEPVRICDWLVSDGAQVTRPSIDPYREEVEISTFVDGSKIRLSSPFFFTHLPRKTPKNMPRIFAKAATSMGLLFDMGEAEDTSLGAYGERIISGIDGATNSKIQSVALSRYLSDSEQRSRSKALQKRGVTVLLRSPSSRGAILQLLDHITMVETVSGIVLDEDDEESDVQLEIAVSLLDRELNRRGLRRNLNVIAEGNDVRGSDDVFKLVSLGADIVGFGKAALLAIGAEEDSEMVLDAKAAQRLENFVIAMQKDIKLLSGAAGLSNISSTLTGNRELLRSVDVDPVLRAQLGVKPVGGA